MRRTVPIAVAMLLAACGQAPRDSALDPASPQAADLAGLYWLSLWMGVAVWIVVMILLAIPIVRSRRRDVDDPPEAREAAPSRSGIDRPAPGALLDEPVVVADAQLRDEAAHDHVVRSRLLWIGGIIGPVIILATLLVASSSTGAATSTQNVYGEELEVEVIGHMFWWEVNYPELGITTANEIHVPVDQPVRLHLLSADVIHSFWIPRLHGKVDMIPGHANELTFVPTEVGFHRGNCAEFCGIAHAQMIAFVQVQEQEDFDAWVAQQQQDRAEPDDEQRIEGERVFIEAGCAACHAVRGTEAVARIGPDLTHLATRETIGAGIAPNERGRLSQLIVDPYGFKPGIPMPPTVLDDDELDALLDYLEGLG